MINPFLIGEKIYLRAPEPGDENVAAAGENHPQPRETLYYALPSSLEQQRAKIKTWQEDMHTVIFTLCTIEPDQPVGLTALVRIDWIGRMATFYISIGDAANWSKGYGSEATRLMVDYAFDILNLNRVQLHVSTENPRAVSVYEKIGFVVEGTLRQAMYHHDRYVDFYLMGILRQDWLKTNRL
ncbi:MAG: GNAT family N-acetyltransferase [Candidatus Delongbacteria bacterium]|nr:GNAT family N-acetyltransferase [Candidatus Delongbacteria bacterium]